MRCVKMIIGTMIMLWALSAGVLAQEAATVITTGEELAAMEYNGNYILANDIVLSGEWLPMHFEGTLDGNGHTITGLNINCTGERNVGMFSWLKGTVSNLTIEDAYIVASGSEGCNASIIGTCDGAWNFDPDTGETHVFNCHVSGTVIVSGSGDLGGSALIGAQDSTADVVVIVEGNSFMSPFLWGSRNCEVRGSMAVYDLGGGKGDVYAILNSAQSTGAVDITLYCDDPEASDVYTKGIGGKWNARSSGCSLLGDIKTPVYASPISNSDNCKYSGTTTSDEIKGMYDCTGCYLDGQMQNYGVCSVVDVSFIYDVVTNNSSEKTSNACDAGYTCNAPSDTKSIYIKNILAPGDRLCGDINISATSTCVSVASNFIKPDDYEKYVYEWENINIRTTEGDIEIYRDTATVGNIECTSDTGKIVITAGAYNSGNVSVSSGGSIDVLGATIYNSGSITGSNSSGGVVMGAYGECALNEGTVTHTGDSTSRISAIGAGGTGSTNNGSVYASNSNTGDASAVGVSGENCLNTASVTSHNSYSYYEGASGQGQSNACGAVGEGSFNTGEISASGNCYLVHAFGNKDGASSTGEVRANGSCIANADGDGGTAIANGSQFASASGVDPYAYGGGGSSLSGATLYYWILRYHDTNHCSCSPAAFIINATGKEPSDAYHNYDLVAMTQLTGFSGGEEPEAGDGEMPEADEPDKHGRVEIALFGEKSEDYAISQFTYAWGSFSFLNADKSDYTHMYARVTVTNESAEEQAFEMKLNLPDGFSVQPWNVQTTVDLSCTVAAGAAETRWVDIYPLYRSDCPAYVAFSVSGDLRNIMSVPVYRMDDEGIALCRPTEKVNSSSTAIRVDLNVDCVKNMVQCSPSLYNDNIALMTCALSQSIYDKTYFDETRKNLGFTCYTFYDSSGNHDVASAYALKKVVSNGVVYPVILATVRGTVGLEWIGNFNVGDNGSYHEDFRACADSTIQRFIEYCDQWQIPAENARAIFSAHSRAAAATNLLAHDLNIANRKYVKDLVAYCYATPNSTQSPSADSNIFNIIYIDDVVAYVPQGYYKNGVTFVLGDMDVDAPSSVNYYYRKYCSRAYMNPRNTGLIDAFIYAEKRGNSLGTFWQEQIGKFLAAQVGDSSVAQAHGAENYLAWAQGNGISGGQSYESVLLERQEEITLTEKIFDECIISIVEDITYKRYYNVIFPYVIYNAGKYDCTIAGVFCPVDVTLRDTDGNIVSQIKDHEFVDAESSDIFAAAVDEHHLFGLAGDADYTFEITGSGAGTMTIEMVMLDKDIALRDYVYFTEVPVAQGETYTLIMDNQKSIQEWTLVSGSGVVYYPGAAPEELPRMYLPAALTEIADEAFLNAGAMTGMLVCPEGMKSIGASAFSGSGFQAIWVPESVVDISDTAFEGADMVIHCYEDSAIHRYAVEKGMAFQLIE